MSELREVFEMVTKQTEPDLDAWNQQEERQRKVARNRKLGVIAVVGALAAVLVLVVALTRPSVETSKPAEEGTNNDAPTETPRIVMDEQDPIIVGLDGTTLQTVIGLPEDAYAFSLSSDGGTIAFVTNADGVNQIATIQIDGGQMRVLGPGEEPAISPDGSQIAFVLNDDIYVMASDGSGVRQVTTDRHRDEFPQWSPDGATIVYDNLGRDGEIVSGFSDTSVIMTVPVGGGEPTLISRGKQDSEPEFSPDGSQIVYRSHADIWIMNADGSGAHRIARNTEGSLDSPRWSPDGTKIAYTDYTSDRRADLYLGTRYGSWPIEIVRVLDVATGEVSKVGNLGMATFENTPQWLPTSDALLLNVATRNHF